jgi:hypothetical protein
LGSSGRSMGPMRGVLTLTYLMLIWLAVSLLVYEDEILDEVLKS